MSVLKYTDPRTGEHKRLNGIPIYTIEIEGGTIAEEQIAQAVAAYFEKNPIDTGSKATTDYVELPAANWTETETENKYAQVVAIDGVTENSQVDLTPSADQLAIFLDKALALVAENEDGIVTVYAIGQKPENDYTIQVTITEVEE